MIEQTQNPFAHLIPAQQNAQQNPFAHLIPKQNVARETIQEPEMPVENQRSKLNTLFRHSGAGLMELGRNMANLPHNLVSSIPEIINPETDYYKLFDAEQGLADKLAVGAAEFLMPLGAVRKTAQGIKLGSELLKDTSKVKKALQGAENFITKTPFRKSAAENIAVGGILGAANAPEGEKLSGAGTGAAIGAGASALGGLTNKLIAQPLAGWYAKSAIPGLVERAQERIFPTLRAPEEIAQGFKGAYEKAGAEAKNLLTSVESQAKQIDDIRSGLPNPKFNISPYKNFINSFLKEKGNLSPAQSKKYEQAIKFAQEEAKAIAPQSFQDVIALRQNLNSYLKKFLEKNNIKGTDYETESFIKGLKNTLNDVIDRNTPAFLKNEVGSFKNMWEQWNKQYGFSQEFKKGVSKSGAIKKKQSLREGLAQEGAPDPAIISEFMPKPGQTEISGFKHLEKLLGNKAKTQEAIKSYYLRQLPANSSTTQDVLSMYSKLSPAQRKYVFGNTKEQSILNAANEAALKFKRPSERNIGEKLIHHGLAYGLPGIAGTSIALHEGLPWHTALLAGLGAGLAGKGAQKAVSKFSTPSSVLKALERNKKGSKNQGKLLNYLFQNPLGGQ